MINNKEKEMKNAYTIVTVGYNHFAFKTMEAAMEFYRMVASSAPVDTHYGDLPDGRKGVRFIREELRHLEMSQVDEKEVEIRFTAKELQERAEAKGDIDGDVKLIDVSDAPLEIGFDEAAAA
jgi:hypothetical protein